MYGRYSASFSDGGDLVRCFQTGKVERLPTQVRSLDPDPFFHGFRRFRLVAS